MNHPVIIALVIIYPVKIEPKKGFPRIAYLFGGTGGASLEK